MKKLLSILLVLVLLLSLVPASLASEEIEEAAAEPMEELIEAPAEEPVPESEEPAAEEPAEEPAQDGATTYNLWIAGTQVTSENRNNLAGGKITYDSTRKVLTVSGDISAGSQIAIHSEISNLYISVQNNVTVSSSHIAILVDADTRIGGSGKLTVNGNNTGIYVRSGTLTVLADLDVAGGNGIMGINGSSGEKLKVGACNVHITATDYGIFNFADITLDRCAITSPAGGKIKGGYAIYDQSNNIATEITIAPQNYNLTVCGTPVTGKNCDDIMGNGIFSYDPEKNMLMVSSSYESWSSILINNNPGLTLYVDKSVKLTSNGYTTVTAYESMTITGPGELTLNSTAGRGIFVGVSATVTVKDTWVDVSGSITGNGGFGWLAIQNSRLAASNESGAIHSLAGITVENSYLSKPYTGAVSGGRVVSGGNLASEVIMQPVTYDLWIAGTRVIGANASDVLGDGVFSYDPAAKKLTIRGNCDYSGGNMIVSPIDGLTIYVAVSSTLSTTDNNDPFTAHHVFVLSGKTILTGPGRLTVSAKSYGFCCGAGILTLQDMDLNVSGTLAMNGLGEAELIIRNSHVCAQATNRAVCDWKSITLDHCVITQPAGGAVKNDGTGIVDKSNSYVKDVTIEAVFILGDVDYSGTVDPADAALMLRAPSSCEVSAGDVSGDNKVTALDAAMVLQYNVGILNDFPMG